MPYTPVITDPDMEYAARVLGLPYAPTASQSETRDNFLTEISSMVGGTSTPATLEQLQSRPGYAQFAQRVTDAGFDPADLVNQRNRNIGDYESGGLASHIGDFMDRSGLGDLITYGTIGVAGLGAAGAFGVGPFAGGGGAASSGAGAAASGSSGAGAAGATSGAVDALTGVTLPASAVPIGAGTSIDALAAGGMATLPASIAGAAGAGAAGTAAASGGGLLSRVGGFFSNNKDLIGSVIGGIGDRMAAEDALDAQRDLLRERYALTAGNYRGASAGSKYRGLMTGTQKQTPMQRFDADKYGGYEYRYDPQQGRIVRVPVEAERGTAI